jgi:hypothetical protein
MLVAAAEKGAAERADHLDPAGWQLVAACGWYEGLHAEAAILILEGEAAFTPLIGVCVIRAAAVHPGPYGAVD